MFEAMGKYIDDCIDYVFDHFGFTVLAATLWFSALYFIGILVDLCLSLGFYALNFMWSLL